MAKYIKAAGQMLSQVKLKKAYTEEMDLLRSGSLAELDAELSSDQKKSVFWVNTYNAYFLHLRKHDKLNRPGIYKARRIIIAGKAFSLDDIEHGILRRFRSKLSLGYLPQLLVQKHIRVLAVDKLDHRIHFALNCGAKSCPPILYYKLSRWENQIKMAESAFIHSETKVDEKKKVLSVSKLFLWYQGDFGGKEAIKYIHKRVLGKNFSAYSISYQDYNWEEDLDNWA